MTKLMKYCVLALAGCAMSATTVFGFSLLGPFDSWQEPELHYQLPHALETLGDYEKINFGPDIGGPQDLGEEYRWTIPTFYYGVDASFLNYFGLRGKEEIDKAIAILNELPAYSTMSETLEEYPLESHRMNYRASALGIYDLKSQALQTTIEYLGLANPERFTWTLRGRDDGGAPRPQFTYLVINRNFDPVTWEPSRYVNGTMYTFRIKVEFGGGVDRSDAQEQLIDPSLQGWTSVAGAYQGIFYPGAGAYYNGLTRDDVGGLRYIYRKDNYNQDEMGPSVFGGAIGGGGSPWAPVTTNAGPTNVVSPNNILRQGVDRIRFIKRDADSLLGTFYTPITNTFTSTYITNGTARVQSLSRALGSVDFIYAALGNSGAGSGSTLDPLLVKQFVGYVSSQGLLSDGNGSTVVNNTLNGPGFMLPPDFNADDGTGDFAGAIGFSKSGPSGTASGGFFVNEDILVPNFRWGSYDGTTNEPVVYPSGSSIKAIEAQVLGGSN